MVRTHERINIKAPNKAVEQIVTALVSIPMTKVRDIEIIDAKPANILMPAAKNMIGMSNKKPIISHHNY